jgi:hypothetical protein
MIGNGKKHKVSIKSLQGFGRPAVKDWTELTESREFAFEKHCLDEFLRTTFLHSLQEF